MINRQRLNMLSSLPGFLICCILLSLAGAERASADDFTGNWSGIWKSYSSESGGLAAAVSQTDNSLSGKLTATNTDCGTFTNLPLSGSVAGNTAAFEASAVCSDDGSFNTLKYTSGSLAENQLSGTYQVYSDGDLYDAGTFTLTRSTNIITASAGTGGSISPSGSVSVAAGSNKTFSITPSAGYWVAAVKVNGATVGAVLQYTFTNVDANHTITASFVAAAPVAAFSAEPVAGKAPLKVNFTDLSTGTISTRSWQFGDGGSSTRQNPSHTYEKPGKFTVSLSVNGPGGSDTETKNEFIIIEAPPISPLLPVILDDD